MNRFRPFLLFVLLLSSAAVGRSESPGYAAFEDSAIWKPISKLPARKGDGAPDIALIDLLSSRPIQLSDFKGQVVYLEFWATWCPSCAPLITKYDRLAEKRKEEWAGKAVIAAISVDTDPKLPRKVAEGNGWRHVRQLWSAMDLSGREALASKAFGIVDLPYAILIDRTGTVVWRGDPARHSAEEQITRLLGVPAAASQ